MRKVAIVGSALLGLASLALPAGRSEANHVQVAPEPAVVYQPPPTAPATVAVVPAPAAIAPATTVTVVPAPSTVVVPAPTATVAVAAQPVLRAEQIRAQVVRAGTIYANRIETDQVKGAVHHAGTVAVNPPTSGEILGPDVTASVIYADAISANAVVADHVYVRDLEMSPSKFVIAPLQSAIVVRRQAP